MIACRQMPIVRFLTTLSLFPLVIPIPIARIDKMDLYEYSSYTNFAWQSWTIFSVISTLALVGVSIFCVGKIVKTRLVVPLNHVYGVVGDVLR